MAETVTPERTLKINISGTVFVVKSDIFMSKDIETPLTSLTRESPYYDVTDNAFCFSRDPDVFYSVLNYFRYGELHLPKFLCGNMIRKELKFWGIPEYSVSECCSNTLHEDDLKLEAQTESTPPLEIKTQAQPVVDKGSLGRRLSLGKPNLRTRIWLTMDHPDYSLFSKIWHNLYACVVLLHTCVFIIWNEEIVRVHPYLTEQPQPDVAGVDSKVHRFFNMDPALGVLCIAVLCNVFFTLELAVHFTVSPVKSIFIRVPRHCINLALIVVTWFVLIVELTNTLSVQKGPFNMFYLFCMGLNPARLVLIFRFSRMDSCWRKLYDALKHSSAELFALFLLFLTGVAIFGTMIHYIEMYQNDFYTNIFDSLWWAIVSMTTLGYGDGYPLSYLGRAFGSVCVCYGIILIAMTVSVVTVNYGEFSRI